MKKYAMVTGIFIINMNIHKIAEELSSKYGLKILPVKIIGKRWEALSSISGPETDICLPVKVLLSSEYGLVVYSSFVPDDFYFEIEQYKTGS